MSRRMTFKTQIAIGYLAPVALLVALCAVVFARARAVQRAYDAVIEAQGVTLLAKDLELDFQSVQRSVRGYILWKNDLSRQHYDASVASYAAKRESIGRTVKDSQQLETLRVIDASKRELDKILDEEIRLVDEGQPERAVERVRTGRGMRIGRDISAHFRRFTDREMDLLVERGKVHAEGLSDLAWLTLAATAFAVALAAAMALVISSRLSRALGAAVSDMATSTTQIAVTVDEHERTVTQQAGAVSETTATVEELGVSSRQSAGQAEATAHAARQAFDVARDGAQLASRAATSMRGMKDKVGSVAEQILHLSEQAAQIGSIASMVSDLASETNMLALNAAVEAARAGDQGRGFAVVAAEIRKLADQTKRSAERAHGLVGDIQKATNSAVMVAEDGARTADEVAGVADRAVESFDAISTAASRVSENAQQVLLNSKQQAIALEQVTVAMKSLAAGSLQISAGTRQTQQGVQKLDEVAADLRALL